CGAGAEVRLEAIRFAGEDVSAHRLDEGKVRQAKRALLVAVAGEGLAAPERDVGLKLLAQGCLADPRLAHNHYQAALTGEGRVEGGLELLQLLLAAHEGAAVKGVVPG